MRIRPWTVWPRDARRVSFPASIVYFALMFLTVYGAMAADTPEGKKIRKADARPRGRDLGLVVGVLPVGPANAITDVAGVTVGHTTIRCGDNIRTGVTAVLPHAGNLFQEKVPGAVFVGNGFGKLAGSTQVNELGQIET